VEGDRPAGQRHQEVAARELDPGEVGDQRESAELGDRRLEDAVVLVRSVPEQVLPVGLHGCQEQPPGDDDADAQGYIARPRAVSKRGDGGVPRSEAHEEGPEDDQRDDREVADLQGALEGLGRVDHRVRADLGVVEACLSHGLIGGGSLAGEGVEGEGRLGRDVAVRGVRQETRAGGRPQSTEPCRF